MSFRESTPLFVDSSNDAQKRVCLFPNSPDTPLARTPSYGYYLSADYLPKTYEHSGTERIEIVTYGCKITYVSP